MFDLLTFKRGCHICSIYRSQRINIVASVDAHMEGGLRDRGGCREWGVCFNPIAQRGQRGGGCVCHQVLIFDSMYHEYIAVPRLSVI